MRRTMPYYLVRAKPKQDHIKELKSSLEQNAFIDMRPFGRSITKGLIGLRVESEDTVVWEEEDHYSPPLAMEHAAVLDKYFDDITVEHVQEGGGWEQIQSLPRLFPELAESVG